MKKITLFVLSLLFAFSLNAQIKVTNGGNVGIGVDSPTDKMEVDGNSRIYGNLKVGQDRGANAATLLVGKDRTDDGIARMDLISDASAYPNFGLRLIRFANGESQITHKGSEAMVFNAADLGGTYDFRIQGLSRVIYTGGAVTPGGDGITNLGDGTHRWADVWCVNGVIQTSDERYKDNIEDLGYGLEDILKLRPVSYTWKENPELGTKLGLIAQEVRPVINEVVRDYDITATTESIKRGKMEYEIHPVEKLGMNYTALIPVLVKGIQDQNKIITDQEEKINDLQGQIDELREMILQGKTPGGTDVIELYGKDATLLQNQPNPFTKETLVNYAVPADFNTARLVITNQNGSIIKIYDIDASGEGQLKIKGNTLSPGTYYYTLVVDGENVDTKTMVLTK